jgi:hypothetical protein
MNRQPAFPTIWENDGDMNNSAPDGAVVPPGGLRHMQGMTMRDYFAAAALQGLIVTAPGALSETANDDKPGSLIVMAAYEFADAMLKEREKK